MKEKTPLSHEVVRFQMISRPQDSKSEVLKSSSWKILENYITSEGAISHNVLYHQPLPITRHQVKFYANNYFESLPIVSTAFKGNFYPHYI